MKHTVFITRNLNTDSIFFYELTEVGFEVFGESLIKFELIPFDNFPKTDWIFFYSKNAVRYFENGLSENDKKFIFKNIKLATIGEGTAKITKEILKKCDFIGDGNPKFTSESFLKIAKNQSVLFPRAENSRQSIQKLLTRKIQSFDFIVYKNQPRKDFELPDFEVLVFTSPMNVETYFNKKKLLDNQKIISIGETTSQVLKKMGFSKIITSQKPTELELANTVQS